MRRARGRPQARMSAVLELKVLNRRREETVEQAFESAIARLWQ